MGWSIGYDRRWGRFIGYGVPAYCDHPKCNAEIDRGLSYVCGGEPFGGERGCGLHFCCKHLHRSARLPQLCRQCLGSYQTTYKPKPEHPLFAAHVLSDPSWAQWCNENPAKVEALKAILAAETVCPA